MSFRRAWITGATGYLGGEFTARFSALFPGTEAVLVVRDPARAPAGFRAVTPDQAVASAAQEAPDLIVHFATHFLNAYSASEAESMIDANVAFPIRLLEAVRERKGVAFLNFGSFYSHADGGGDSPATFYAASKRAFESFLKYYAGAGIVRALTLKLYDTYGPADPRKKLIPKFAEIAASGAAMDLSPGDQKLNLLHVDDVVAGAAHAIRRLETSNGYETFQLSAAADPQKLPSLKEVAAAFERATGKRLALRFGALPYRDREIMIPRMDFAILPGWSPKIALEDGFRAFA